MAIQMTRAEYEAKYGAQPPVPQKQPTLASLPANTIVKRKQDAYAVPAGALGTNLRQQKLQKLQNEQADAAAEAKKANSFGGFMGNFGGALAENLTIGTKKLGETLGQSLAAPKVTKQIADDRNLQSDTLISLSKRIRENEAAGKDTTKLKLAYNNLADDYDPEEMKKILPVLNKTNAQVAGELAGTALDLVGGASLPKAVGAVTNVISKPFFSKATVGRVAGPGALGYATDVASGLSGGRGEDREGFAALIPGAGTALGVGIPLAGAALRGAGVGTRSAMQNATPEGKDARAFKETIDTIAPRLTAKEKDAAILSGQGNVSGILKKATIDFSKDPQMVEAAQAARGVVDPKKTSLENVNLVLGEVENSSENVVKPFLTENPVQVNFADFRKKLEMVQPSSSLKSDPSAYKNYTRIREEILDDVANFIREQGDAGKPVDLNAYWDSRKILDSKINAELGATTFDSPQYSGAKAAATDLRKAFGDFMSDALEFPGQQEQLNKMQDFLSTFRARGGQIPNEQTAIDMLVKQFGLTADQAATARAAFFRDNMKRLSSLYNAADSLTTKARGELGTNAVGRAINSPLGKAVRNTAIGLGVGGGVIAGTSAGLGALGGD